MNGGDLTSLMRDQIKRQQQADKLRSITIVQDAECKKGAKLDYMSGVSTTAQTKHWFRAFVDDGCIKLETTSEASLFETCLIRFTRKYMNKQFWHRRDQLTFTVITKADTNTIQLYDIFIDEWIREREAKKGGSSRQPYEKRTKAELMALAKSRGRKVTASMKKKDVILLLRK